MAKPNGAPPDGAIDTLIGENSAVEGSFDIATGIKVEGQLKGSLKSPGTLSVGPNGKIEAEIEVREAIIAGTVVGEIVAEHRVELESTSRVYADLKTSLLIIEEGAVFRGKVESGEPLDRAALGLTESPSKKPGDSSQEETDESEKS
ncbi:MAG: polymer-forming cytoskeletal protein [Candidatus Latescibacteria bacterium]|jgi:cytoskeletal protein CcmA (bactofilin family)|nr:polymer-forming cytoskeletal protein [Candidatus Latescibacterota bacterium]